MRGPPPLVEEPVPTILGPFEASRSACMAPGDSVSVEREREGKKEREDERVKHGRKCSLELLLERRTTG